MQQLKIILASNPNIVQISLDFQNIRDLTLCMTTLQKFPYLQSLSLHGNQLRMLPAMSQLNLTTLDISNNPLEIDNYLLDSLFSLPSLQNLNIDGSEAELQRILENLPNLKVLNKKKVIREKKLTTHNDLGQRMKTSLQRQKQKIKQLAHNIFSKFQYKDKNLVESFDKNFDEILEQYRNFSDNVSIDTAKEGVFLFSKSKFLDVLHQKFINVLSENGMQSVADAVQQINILRKQYFDSLLKIVLQVGYNEVCLEDDLQEQLNLQMRNVKLRKQRLYLRQIMRLKKKINDYRTYLNKIEEENGKYLHTLYSIAGGDYKHILQKHQIIRSPKHIQLIAPRMLNRQNSQRIPDPKTTPKRQNLTPSKSSQKLREQPTKSGRKISRDKQNRNPNKVLLNYDQTINLMQQFIASKHAHNEKAKKKKQSYDTAQEYLSSFFTAKYGVKTIAINWSLNFIRSLEVYARDSTLCQVFLKILKHSIQQSFYEQHLQFVQSIRQELQLMNRQQNISAGEAQNLFLHYFPTENPDQFKIITNFSQLTPQNICKQLCKVHVQTHEKLITQFSNLFRKHDSDQDGALTLTEAKQFVAQFFRPKVQKAIVTGGIVEKVIKKLDPLKKNKIIFSELVEIIDKIN